MLSAHILRYFGGVGTAVFRHEESLVGGVQREGRAEASMLKQKMVL